MKSPTSRTLDKLRKEGYKAQVVEHWNSWAKVRQDLFGFIDVVAIRADCKGVYGVQATTYSNAWARVKKIREIEAALVWLAAGNRLEVWGWHNKQGKWDAYVVDLGKVLHMEE